MQPLPAWQFGNLAHLPQPQSFLPQPQKDQQPLNPSCPALAAGAQLCHMNQLLCSDGKGITTRRHPEITPPNKNQQFVLLSALIQQLVETVCLSGALSRQITPSSETALDVLVGLALVNCHF